MTTPSNQGSSAAQTNITPTGGLTMTPDTGEYDDCLACAAQTGEGLGSFSAQEQKIPTVDGVDTTTLFNTGEAL